MRRAALLVLAACSSTSPKPAPPGRAPAPPVTPAVIAPDPQNLGFEQLEAGAPRAWYSTSGPLAAVTEDKHGGTHSLRLDGERVAIASIDATPYRGARLAVRGWIKTAESAGAGLWIRADTPSDMLELDNMQGRYVTGTQAWTAVRAEIAVDDHATKIVFGALQVGHGAAWFDDLAFEAITPTQIVLAGSVLDPAGAPATGAEVALIDMKQDLVQHVQTDAAGHFEFRVVAGTWGVSAHRPGAVGAFVGQHRYDATKQDLKIALAKDGGATVRGKVTQKVAPGTYLQVSPYSDNDADLFAVPVHDDGTFEAAVPRGSKYYVAVIGGSARGQFDRKGDFVDVVLETPSLDPAPAEVIDYIGKHAIALTTVEAGNGLDDMAPLGKLVGKAKIIALGEATHGSREIFQMKHRFLEYLVAKQGFTVFAIEANQPECRAINDYVLAGKGTAKEALAGIYFWTWNTEEVLAMIEWMRAWNADPKHAKKVQFTGFDMQTSKVAHAHVAAAVKQLAPDRADALLAPLAPLGEASSDELVKNLAPAAQKALTDALAALAPVLAKADADTRHDLRILEQATVMYTEKTPFDARDRAMAENVGWLLDTTKARIVVWAHNGHISKLLDSFRNMGSQLSAKYKADYVPIGFVFGQGGFQAMDWSKESRRLGEITIGPAPEHFASAAFAKTGKPLLVLDVRTLPKGKVAAWFGAKHPLREAGAVFSSEATMVDPQALAERYDAVIYIDKTTRARPLTK
jgi:erythromycin esterase